MLKARANILRGGFAGGGLTSRTWHVGPYYIRSLDLKVDCIWLIAAQYYYVSIKSWLKEILRGYI